MIKVSKETKQAYMSDVSKKTLRVVFPELDLTYSNESINSESMKITESISSKDSVEFVGCIASSLQIEIYGIQANIKGRRIEVYIRADNTEEIPLFKGIVDSAVIDSNKLFKKITAYDVLYSKGDTDVVGWYHQMFPTNESTRTLGELRNSIFSYIGIQQVATTLPNDEIVIGKKFDPKSLKCITVLKSICQINGCCGIINRNGVFEYRYIAEVFNGEFPSVYLFPGAETFPQTSNVANTFAFYETLEFEEYFVKPMERVQIRQDEKDIGVTVGGSNGNKYIIQSNMFAQGLVPSVAATIAQNILRKLKYATFYPCKTKNNGLPFVECGDAVKYVLSASREGRYATNTFIVLSRTISGVQLLKDNYSASGSEEQSEFITDLQTTLDTIKMQGGGSGGGDMSDYYTKEQVNDIVSDFPQTEDVEDFVAESVSQMETPTGFNVVSTYTLPTTRAANTIYLIQGGVVIL